MNQLTKISITCGIAIGAAFNTLAGAHDAYWTVVDNSSNHAEQDTGIANNWMTFDLYVPLSADERTGFLDFGNVGVGSGVPNTGISTNGDIYDGAMFSSDSVVKNISLSYIYADLEYDTAVTANGGLVTFVATINEIHFDPSGFNGAWRVNPSRHGSGGPQGPNDMWVARITVSADATTLGGQMFIGGDVDNDILGAVVTFSRVIAVPEIDPSAFAPAPGSVAVLTLGAIAAIRRKR